MFIFTRSNIVVWARREREREKLCLAITISINCWSVTFGGSCCPFVCSQKATSILQERDAWKWGYKIDTLMLKIPMKFWFLYLLQTILDISQVIADNIHEFLVYLQPKVNPETNIKSSVTKLPYTYSLYIFIKDKKIWRITILLNVSSVLALLQLMEDLNRGKGISSKKKGVRVRLSLFD